MLGVVLAVLRYRTSPTTLNQLLGVDATILPNWLQATMVATSSAAPTPVAGDHEAGTDQPPPRLLLGALLLLGVDGRG